MAVVAITPKQTAILKNAELVVQQYLALTAAAKDSVKQVAPNLLVAVAQLTNAAR